MTLLIVPEPQDTTASILVLLHGGGLETNIPLVNVVTNVSEMELYKSHRVKVHLIAVGVEMGAFDGIFVGDFVGIRVGTNVGFLVGVVVGALVGALLGCWVGDVVGTSEGEMMGAFVGTSEGDLIGVNVGIPEGILVGATIGWLVLAMVKNVAYISKFDVPLLEDTL